MFQRSLTRSLRQTSSITSQVTCTLCRCSCGRRFRPDGFGTIQKRFYEPVKNLENPYAADIRRKREKEEKERREERYYYDGLVTLKNLGELQCTVDAALEFMNSFAQPKIRSPGTHAGTISAEDQSLRGLMAHTQVSDNDVRRISFMLLNDNKVEYKALGKKMLYGIARTGSWFAITDIISNALVEAKNDPSVMKRKQLLPVRKALEGMAERPGIVSSTGITYYTPMVLLGKVFYAVGDVDGAIKWWERSLPAAIADSEDRNSKPYSQHQTSALNAALQSPWVELTNAYLAKQDLANARWAAEIGCAQDDPTSHYSMALLENATNEDGDHVATSTWLYHITKAAGAHQVKAAHVLGNWYASSGWKYVEDEPPDEIKPTPFDSYPPAKNSHGSIWNQMSTAIGLKKPPSDTNMQHQLFLTAAFPDTALSRFNIGLQWLEVSMSVMYAPSYLLAAKLLLEKTLWPAANAPKSALELKSDRYTYASEADYQAGKPINKPSKRAQHKEKEIPNPGYDPDRAKDLIREVFYAVQALDYRRRLMTKVNRRKGAQAGYDFDEDYYLVENRLNFWPASVRKWFRFPESREMYADDARGVLWDDELKLDLKVTARQVCEEQGWDIYDEEGGLMFRHGMKTK